MTDNSNEAPATPKETVEIDHQKLADAVYGVLQETGVFDFAKSFNLEVDDKDMTDRLWKRLSG